MNEFLSTRDVDEFFNQLRDGAQKLFSNRLDLGHLLEHQLNILTETERFDFHYISPHLEPTSDIDGILEITYWEPSGETLIPSAEDIEADYDEEILAVDRTDFMFNLFNHYFERRKTICKCILSDELLYEPVEEIALSYIVKNTGENPEVEMISEAVEMEVDKISYRDREELAKILFRVGVLI